MKFSKSTIEILKSFTTINQNLHFKKGNILTCLHPQRVIMGQAQIEDHIPQDFAIHNLNTFLGVISLLSDPDLDFKKDKVVIRQGNTSVNFGFADPAAIKSPPDKEITIDSDVTFQLTKDELDAVRKASTVMMLDYVKIEGDGEKVSVTAYDAKDPSSNSFSIETAATSDKKFTAIFKVANLNIVPGTYDIGVAISGKSKAGEFKCKDQPIKYLVAVEGESTLG